VEFWLEIDGETMDFDVTPDGDEILVTRDGVTRPVTVECAGALYRAIVESKTYELNRDGAEPRGLHGDVLSLERGGAAFQVTWVGRKGGHPASGGDEVASDGAVFPLMPGIIMEVHVAVGDAVAEGDMLLVLEAMKMLNEIASPLAGTVAEVNVKAGDNVDRRTMMVRIEPEAPGGS